MGLYFWMCAHTFSSSTLCEVMKGICISFSHMFSLIFSPPLDCGVNDKEINYRALAWRHTLQHNLFLICVPMYTVWSHSLCLSFGKISPCAVAAGSALYLHVLSPLEGGAQCLPVIKVFTEKRPNCFHFMWRKVNWVTSNICNCEVCELLQR